MVKRYTAPYQKLQLLVVFTALTMMMLLGLMMTCTQLWLSGEGWLEVVICTVIAFVPACAAFQTYRDLCLMIPTTSTDD
jgi:hypothetical protein